QTPGAPLVADQLSHRGLQAMEAGESGPTVRRPHGRGRRTGFVLGPGRAASLHAPSPWSEGQTGLPRTSDRGLTPRSLPQLVIERSYANLTTAHKRTFVQVG